MANNDYIINEIINIELMAQGITTEALKRQEELDAFVAQRSKKIQDEIMQEADARAQKLLQKETARHEREMKQLQAAHDESVVRVSKEFEKNYEKWKAEILDNICRLDQQAEPLQSEVR